MFKPTYLNWIVRGTRGAVAFIAVASVVLAAGGAGGGGGGTGGGGGGGGGGTVAPPSTCSTISSFSLGTSRAKYGYPWSEVTANYTLKSCSADFFPVGRITVTNLDTGLVLAAWNTGGLVGSAVTAAPDGTNIRVDIVVTDPNTGIVVDSRSATATTPAPRVKTT